MKPKQNKPFSKSKAIVWADRRLQSSSSSSFTTAFQGAAQQPYCNLSSALAVAVRFWNCLQLLLCFCTFSNYTLPFEYNIWFKYLENANFFIYTCLKKTLAVLRSLGNSVILASLLSVNYSVRLRLVKNEFCPILLTKKKKKKTCSKLLVGLILAATEQCTEQTQHVRRINTVITNATNQMKLQDQSILYLPRWQLCNRSF